MKVKISNDEIRDYLDIDNPEFPKYTTQLLNLANQNAQGTRPSVVGQMSDLIQHFTGKSLHEWEVWYSQEKPDAIRNATEKVYEMVQKLRIAIDMIDRDMVEMWVKDLVIVKTFMGLRFQEAILKRAAEIMNSDYRLSDSSEESQGIDGYVGEIPVSIKPGTYKVKASLSETISAKIIFYEKIKNGIEIDFSDLLAS